MIMQGSTESMLWFGDAAAGVRHTTEQVYNNTQFPRYCACHLSQYRDVWCVNFIDLSMWQ